ARMAQSNAAKAARGGGVLPADHHRQARSAQGERHCAGDARKGFAHGQALEQHVPEVYQTKVFEIGVERGTEGLQEVGDEAHCTRPSVRATSKTLRQVGW